MGLPFKAFWEIIGNVENSNNTRMWRLMVSVCLSIILIGGVTFVTWSWCQINSTVMTIDEAFPAVYVDKKEFDERTELLRKELSDGIKEIRGAVKDMQESQNDFIRIVLDRMHSKEKK